MSLTVYHNLEKALNTLTEKGFTDRFYFVDGQLKSTVTPTTYLPKELQIAEYHRFRSPTPQNNETTLTVYALYTSRGEPGLFVHRYDLNDPLHVVSFLERVPICSAENLSTTIDD